MTHATRVTALTAIAAALHLNLTQAQSPTFDSASVKRNNSGEFGATMYPPTPGRFRAANIPVRQLLRRAYGIQDSRMVGAPAWIDTERFDVDATFTPAPNPGGNPGGPDRLTLMLRALLAERFKLAAHNENRELPLYALVLARSDGKLGPQLRKSTVDCPPPGPQAGPGGPGGPGGPPPGGPGGPRPGGPPPGGPGQPGQAPGGCGINLGGMGRMVATGTPIAQIVPLLSQLTQRPVVDRTGLTGAYDLELTFTPDQLPPGPPPPGAPPINTNGPSLVTALQEQLGLKLDSQKGPLEVLVIDHIERPTDN